MQRAAGVGVGGDLPSLHITSTTKLRSVREIVAGAAFQEQNEVRNVAQEGEVARQLH
jgi:hypothetical protein